MCRWLAYSGTPLMIEEVLFKPRHSLIDQSMSSKSAETPTNGDGFGLGWYGQRKQPGLFRSIRPAQNRGQTAIFRRILHLQKIAV